MDKVLPRVFFCGSSGTGKTTLAEFVHATFGLPLIQLDGAALAEQYGGFAVLARDRAAADAYQLERTRRRIDLILASAGGCVSEHSIDEAAYSAFEARICWQIARGEPFQALVRHLRGLDDRINATVLFHLRPNRLVNEAARNADAGRRDRFLDWDYVNQIDGAITYLLESHEIPYVPIDTPSLPDRRKLVQRVVTLATG